MGENQIRKTILDYAIINRKWSFTLKDVVEGTNLPIKTVEKTLQKLKEEGILKSKSDKYRFNSKSRRVEKAMKEYFGDVCKGIATGLLIKKSKE